MDTFSVIKRSPEAAQRTREILGIPEAQDWSDLKVEFGLDLVGTATVTFLLSSQQTIELAELAAQRVDLDLLRGRAVEDIQRDLVD